MEFLTPDEMRAAEQRAVARGIDTETMMENAGRAIALMIDERYRTKGTRRALVVCGTGNNGGDGFVVARYLKKRKWTVLVLLLGAPVMIKTHEAAKNWRLVESSVVSIGSAADLLKHRKYFDKSDVIVDAILGTGAQGGLREPALSAVELMNRSSGVKVAVDIPSGLDPLTGETAGPAVKADLTISLHRAKAGLAGRSEYTGEIAVVPIGIDER